MNLTPPTYLRGVEDIRPESDGGVSFYDPKNLTGAFGKENNRTRLSPEQSKWTFDNVARLSNLDKAVNKQYKGLDSMKGTEQMIMDTIGDKVRSAARWATSSPEKSRVTTGALGALGAGGAVLGLGLGGVTPALVAALGVGGLGALLSGLSQRQFRLREQNKTASRNQHMSTAILSNPGALRMLAAVGLDKNAGAQAIGYDEVMREHGLPVQQQIAKFASTLFEETHPLHHLFNGLSKAATWFDEYDEFTDCVCRAMNRHDITKSALLPVVLARMRMA